MPETGSKAIRVISGHNILRQERRQGCNNDSSAGLT
jgi:hypothetical protein